MRGIERRREVVLLSKAGCHLCEAVETEIRSIGTSEGSLNVVDIDEDPALHDVYWLRVPVVRVGGQDVFDATMMDVGGRWRKELARILL